jgi:hypothetical protein
MTISPVGIPPDSIDLTTVLPVFTVKLYGAGNKPDFIVMPGPNAVNEPSVSTVPCYEFPSAVIVTKDPAAG